MTMDTHMIVNDKSDPTIQRIFEHTAIITCEITLRFIKGEAGSKTKMDAQDIKELDELYQMCCSEEILGLYTRYL